MKNKGFIQLSSMLISASILCTLLGFPCTTNEEDINLSARTSAVWNVKNNSYVELGKTGGYNMLLKGSSRYLNFNVTSGSTGYGVRDNAGSMEFKDSGGVWAGIGTGGDFAWTDETYGVSTTSIVAFLSGSMSMTSTTIIGPLRHDGNSTTTGNQIISGKLQSPTMYFNDTAYPQGITHNIGADVIEVLPYDAGGASNIGGRQNFYIYSNFASDGSGTYEPGVSFLDTGIIRFFNSTQGDAGNKYLHVDMTDGILVTGSATVTEAMITKNATSTNSIEVGSATGANIDWSGGDLVVADVLEVEGDFFFINATSTGSVDALQFLVNNTPLDIAGWDAHIVDNTQAHTDYLLNSGSDTMGGTLTADGLTLGANELITIGAQTLTHDGTDFIFNDSLQITGGASFNSITTTDTAYIGGESYLMGNVGIGTDSPDGKLHVNSGSALADVALLERSGVSVNAMYAAARITATKATDMVDGFGSALGFSIQDDAEVINTIGTIGAIRDNNDDDTGSLAFKTITNGNPAETRMIIKYDGNVGIGTNIPVFKLEVMGTASTSALAVGNLVSCDTIDTDAKGVMSCGSDATGAGGGVFAWTDTTFGMSTTTGLEFGSGFMSQASSTVIGDFRVDGNATTTGSFDAQQLLVNNVPLAIANWDSAFGWGDWSGEGFITDLSGFTTANLSENTNLYYTDVRVRDFIQASTTIQDHFTNADEAQGWGDWSGEGFIVDTDLNTFSELQSLIADKTLINEEDAITFDSTITHSVESIFTTGARMSYLNASSTLTDAFAVAGTANNTSTIAENLEVFGNASTTELTVGGSMIKFGNGMCMGEDSATTTPNITIQACDDF